MKYAFLGFIKKNLKPKKLILGGKKLKTENSEDVILLWSSKSNKNLMYILPTPSQLILIILDFMNSPPVYITSESWFLRTYPAMFSTSRL